MIQKSDGAFETNGSGASPRLRQQTELKTVELSGRQRILRYLQVEDVQGRSEDEYSVNQRRKTLDRYPKTEVISKLLHGPPVEHTPTETNETRGNFEGSVLRSGSLRDTSSSRKGSESDNILTGIPGPGKARLVPRSRRLSTVDQPPIRDKKPR
jgi:hypothetical protein